VEIINFSMGGNTNESTKFGEESLRFNY